MEEILNQYREHHSNINSEITEESLEKRCRKFLSTVKPEGRFEYLNIDFYRNVLGKICRNENSSEGNEKSLQSIMAGFNHLEKYAINLWKFPWRKEYHTIKLNTAFFKCNIEQALKDTEAIFDLLKSLGYTVMEQQKVSIKESEKQHVIWASLSLFLVRVDLKVIKEIMDHFPNNEFTLNEIVRVRSKTSDVEHAVYYLRKAAKRRKMEEPRESDAPPHGHTKKTHIGRVDAFKNLQSDTTHSDVVTSADQNTRMPPRLSVLSKGREDVAADSHDSLTGSAVSKMHRSISLRTGTTGGRHFTSMSTEQLEQFSDHDLYGVSSQGSQPCGVTQHNLDASNSTVRPTGTLYEGNQNNLESRYSTFPQTGSLHEANQHNFDPRHSTVPQGRLSQHYDNKGTQRNQAPQVGHPQYADSTKDRMDAAATTSHLLSHYKTVTPSHSSYQYSNQSIGEFVRDNLKSEVSLSGKVGAIANSNGYQSKMSARTETQLAESSSGNARNANLRDISSSADRQFRSNKLDDPMSTKDSVRGRGDRDARYGQTYGSGAEPMEVKQIQSSHDRRSDEYSSCNGVGEGATAKSKVTELDTTLKQFTLEPGDDVAATASKQVSGASNQPTKQYGSANVPDVKNSREGVTNQGQPSTATNEIGQITRSSATEIKGHTEVKGSSPVPSWRTPRQRERAQNTAHSSKNELGTSREGNMLPKATRGDNDCELCQLRGTLICRNCFLVICRECLEVYVIDLCDKTKGDHAFVNMKDDKVQQIKSVDAKASTSQHYANINEGFEDQENGWPCSRCTFLNPLDNKICAMCATTRGVGPVELTEAGSRVCRECTYHNKEDAKVCKACHKTLDLKNPETSV